MEERRNYQRELDRILADIPAEEVRPVLLLHACCAPCSSYVLEYLSRCFRICLFYYNPNITEEEEYRRRKEEILRFVSVFPAEEPVEITEAPYDPETFLAAARGLEEEEEGGRRCARCFELRLRAAAKKAREIGADWFTTTLSISPLKNAAVLNAIGERIGAEEGVAYLPSDFKKRGGARRSVELSKIYDLYRQDYCGCEYSKRNEVK